MLILICYLICTELDEIWKTTSLFLRMEEDLIFFSLNFFSIFLLVNLGSWFLVCNIVSTQLDKIWKTTSIFWKMKDDLNFLKMKSVLDIIYSIVIPVQGMVILLFFPFLKLRLGFLENKLLLWFLITANHLLFTVVPCGWKYSFVEL